TRHPRVDASEIEVSVKEGEITLEGTIPERQMKRVAEDCVEATSGARQVHNRLRVAERKPSG
ncbi:MAG: BON domain-containing protein, partial [Solirubrobacteraceae bacterium]